MTKRNRINSNPKNITYVIRIDRIRLSASLGFFLNSLPQRCSSSQQIGRSRTSATKIATMNGETAARNFFSAEENEPFAIPITTRAPITMKKMAYSRIVVYVLFGLKRKASL